MAKQRRFTPEFKAKVLIEHLAVIGLIQDRQGY